MKIGVRELDQFISTSDRLGGPGPCAQFWAEFQYVPTFQVNQDLDPFSEAYVAQQFKLYEEIAGHEYDVHSNENTPVDVQKHVAATNPYDHPDPAALATHIERLSVALRHARPKRGDLLLDMGCGWGLSSEIAAYTGLRVTAVDVNPDFVRLVAQRARKGLLPITAIHSTFDEYSPTESFDVALFYECLHHSVRPWMLLSRLTSSLKMGGRLVLAGEPINDYWWKHWGLRLDAISVYCIRKYGWFESGWTRVFIQQVLYRVGLMPRLYLNPDAEIGYTILGEKVSDWIVPATTILELFEPTGCITDAPYLILVGQGALSLVFPAHTTRAVMNLKCFRARNLRVSVRSEASTFFAGTVSTGDAEIAIPRVAADTLLVRFEVESWVPDEELHNGDGRRIGIHLESITFH